MEDCVTELLRLYNEEKGTITVRDRWGICKEGKLGGLEARLSSEIDPCNSMIVKVTEEEEGMLTLYVSDVPDLKPMYIFVASAAVLLVSVLAFLSE